MTWSYDPSAIQSDPLYKLRFEIGDTVSSRPLLENEELSALLTLYDYNEAAARACEAIAAKLAGTPNFSRGSWSETLDRVIAEYKRMAVQFRARRGGPIVIPPTVGDTTEERKPYFDVGMMDYPVAKTLQKGTEGA